MRQTAIIGRVGAAGQWDFVLNTFGATPLLVLDRRANGYAFQSERLIRLPRRHPETLKLKARW